MSNVDFTELLETWINGNLSDARQTIQALNKKDSIALLYAVTQIDSSDCVIQYAPRFAAFIHDAIIEA